MATLVCFHAHPDDECVQTGGTMAKAAAAGHRVVLVVATGGEHGEVPDGFLAEGEALADRRASEVAASCEVLGVSRLALLGYVDSGMHGTPQNEAPDAFCNADLEEAAQRLAAILVEEAADVVTYYDRNGLYGHPDHIKVHHVGRRAAELAGTPRVFQSTMDRDFLRAGMEIQRELAIEDGVAPEDLPDVPEVGDEFGSASHEITTAVDVSEFVQLKRQALRCHPSQVTDGAFFLTMPDEAFASAFGTEWYILEGAPVPGADTDLLAGL